MEFSVSSERTISAQPQIKQDLRRFAGGLVSLSKKSLRDFFDKLALSAVPIAQAAEVACGVGGRAVETNLKVAMRAGGPAGAAHIADSVALTDRLPGAHRDGGHMRVHRGIAVAVVYHYIVAIGIAVCGLRDRAAVRGDDG